MKALLYFEVVTTLALIIGLIVVNTLQPGAGFTADYKADPADLAQINTYGTQAKDQTVANFFLDMIPTSFADPFVTGKMLQIIFVAVLFGIALGHLPDRGRPLLVILETTVQALFVIVRIIMRLAPLAAFGAMAYAVGKYGLGTLLSYGKLIACLYITSMAFIFIVLGSIAWLSGISLWRFLVYIREEIGITFATASTETVFPRMIHKLEHLGCSKPVVGLVLPAGYAFNADGGCIYITMAAIFLAQATHTPLALKDQIVILMVCLFTSKGAAGVAGAGFIALAATLLSMDKIPASSLILLLGVDRFLNEARAVTNLIGNGIATVAVARWEGALNLQQANAVLNVQQEITQSPVPSMPPPHPTDAPASSPDNSATESVPSRRP